MEHSEYQLKIANDSVQSLATGWLVLGVAALAIAGLFSVLLVLSRTPGFQEIIPWLDFFHTALVVHVDQSVLIWFLAFGGLIWSIHGQIRTPVRLLTLGLAAAGTLIVAVSPFLGAGDPLMNNYVPVLRHPLFYTGLGLFGLGLSIQAVLNLGDVMRLRFRGFGKVAGVASFTAALATVFAVVSLLWSFWGIDDQVQGQAFFEYLFWGGGHVLQFTFTQLMLLAWLWLAAATRIPLVLGKRALIGLLLLGVAPVLLVPLIHMTYPVVSGESRLAFIRLMQWGGGIAAIPIGLVVTYGMLRRAVPVSDRERPVRRSLGASVVLFAVGGIVGVFIAGVNTVIPAHYHGSIVGVTLALMGLTYHLLPELGFAPVVGRMAAMQPLVYATGQLLHVGGLAVSGAMGIQRKTAGAAQGLDNLPAVAAMGIMGIGGLLAVIGGILFVVVVLQAMWRKPGGKRSATFSNG